MTFMPLASGKMRSIAFIALLSALAVSLSLNVHTFLNRHRIEGNPTSKAPFQPGTIILPPVAIEALISDLTSGDKAALERWRTYFYVSAGYDPNYNEAHANSGLKETAALYAAKEKPGRSNFFNRLVLDLREEHARKPLSRQAVLSFLGQPDAIIKAADGEMMQYQYSCYGRTCLSSVVVSNGTVSRIDMYGR